MESESHHDPQAISPWIYKITAGKLNLTHKNNLQVNNKKSFRKSKLQFMEPLSKKFSKEKNYINEYLMTNKFNLTKKSSSYKKNNNREEFIEKLVNIIVDKKKLENITIRQNLFQESLKNTLN